MNDEMGRRAVAALHRDAHAAPAFPLPQAAARLLRASSIHVSATPCWVGAAE
jgi:hypothetical protein